MALKNKHTYLTLISLVASVICWSQKQDTTFHYEYQSTGLTSINLDFNYTDIIITPSLNDTIGISTSISLIPTNASLPFYGIDEKTTKSQNEVSSNITVSPDIQDENALKILCYLSLPENSKLLLNCRYGEINILQYDGKLDADLEYCTLKANALKNANKHTITANYSELYIDTINAQLTLSGTNIKLKSKYIQQLNASTKFSNITASHINKLQTEAYSNRSILGQVDTAIINSEYSSYTIENLFSFFQSEMHYGSLTIKQVAPDFKVINIANSYVSSQLSFTKQAAFILNADMRYCELISDQLSLKAFASPNGNLYNGIIGRDPAPISKLSLISSFGDVSLTLQP